MMPASLPSASMMPTQPKPFADISTIASDIGGAERDQRHGRAGVHHVADEFQLRAEPPARMQDAEIERREAAAFQQRDRERIAERKLHQRGGGRREIVRAGLARLRQQQHDVGRLRERAVASAVTAISPMRKRRE